MSGLTFTSLGFYDLMPVGWGKLLAVAESITGFVIMSLLVAIFIDVITAAKDRCNPGKK